MKKLANIDQFEKLSTTVANAKIDSDSKDLWREICDIIDGKHKFDDKTHTWSPEDGEEAWEKFTEDAMTDTRDPVSVYHDCLEKLAAKMAIAYLDTDDSWVDKYGRTGVLHDVKKPFIDAGASFVDEYATALGKVKKCNHRDAIVRLLANRATDLIEKAQIYGEYPEELNIYEQTDEEDPNRTLSNDEKIMKEYKIPQPKYMKMMSELGSDRDMVEMFFMTRQLPSNLKRAEELRRILYKYDIEPSWLQ